MVQPETLLLPPLHIKLGLIKQLVKSFKGEGEVFKYLQWKFPNKSEDKLEEGVFNEPEIRKLFRDTKFVESMNSQRAKAWLSFQAVVENFLGNMKSPSYEKDIGCCLLNLKLHLLLSIEPGRL